MIESQVVTELAALLYDFLPASFSAVTWPGVAARCGVEDCWPNGISKRQSIPIFLRNLLECRRYAFCNTIVTVIQEGMNYKLRCDRHVTREEIDSLNVLLLKVQFKIPELHDPVFLAALPREKDQSASAKDAQPSVQTLLSMHTKFIDLFSGTNSQKRGYQFEGFLNDFFSHHGLNPKSSFRMLGEQIDGSFEWQGSTFIVEARWRTLPANTADMLVLRGKAEKSDWTRGLFISINGFSDITNQTLAIGRKANLIAMSGQDLILILENRLTLFDALSAKLRHTGETAEAYVALSDLLRGS
jgi:hypothetical protein